MYVQIAYYVKLLTYSQKTPQLVSSQQQHTFM